MTGSDNAAQAKQITSEREFKLSPKVFDLIRKKLYDHAGIALADHKVDLVYNRLVRRIRALKLAGFTQYLDYMDQQDDIPEPHNSQLKEWRGWITLTYIYMFILLVTSSIIFIRKVRG
mgnify:CR=1 FL=1